MTAPELERVIWPRLNYWQGQPPRDPKRSARARRERINRKQEQRAKGRR